MTVGLPRSVYVHVPFCRHRCGYCNFNLVADRGDLIPAYLEALGIELERCPPGLPIDTLFLGGGTPTELDAASLRQLLGILTSRFRLADDAEFSIEANPRDLTGERIAVLTEFGVNRISLGVQSFQAAKLQRLERDHTPKEAAAAIERAQATIPQVAIDLIFAAPAESLADWESDLQQAIDLGVEHVSTYGLTYDKGAQFWGRRLRGELTELEEEVQREMYLAAIDRLTAAGRTHYEVSNFAAAGRACRHNQTYWLGRPWEAFGPGAARFVDHVRATNHGSTFTYIRRLRAGHDPTATHEPLTAEQIARERVVFGLRLLDGLDLEDFAAETGCDAVRLLGPALADALEHGLLALDARRLRLTRAGLLVSDAIWPKFLDPTE